MLLKVHFAAPEAQIIASHMEGMNHWTLSRSELRQYSVEHKLIGNLAQIEGYEKIKQQYFVYAETSGYLMYSTSIKAGTVIDNTVVGSISEMVSDSNSIIECYIPSEQRSFIENNQEIEMIVSGLSQSKYGTLLGKIESISDDVITDNEQNVYYVVKVKPTTTQLKDKKLVNGQVVEVRVKYEESTWLHWALKKVGIVDR